MGGIIYMLIGSVKYSRKCFPFYVVTQDMLFPVQYLALFHLFNWSTCIASTNVRTECRNMRNVHTESIKESAAVLAG